MGELGNIVTILTHGALHNLVIWKKWLLLLASPLLPAAVQVRKARIAARKRDTVQELLTRLKEGEESVDHLESELDYLIEHQGDKMDDLTLEFRSNAAVFITYFTLTVFLPFVFRGADVPEDRRPEVAAVDPDTVLTVVLFLVATVRCVRISGTNMASEACGY